MLLYLTSHVQSMSNANAVKAQSMGQRNRRFLTKNLELFVNVGIGLTFKLNDGFDMMIYGRSCGIGRFVYGRFCYISRQNRDLYGGTRKSDFVVN